MRYKCNTNLCLSFSIVAASVITASKLNSLNRYQIQHLRSLYVATQAKRIVSSVYLPLSSPELPVFGSGTCASLDCSFHKIRLHIQLMGNNCDEIHHRSVPNIKDVRNLTLSDQLVVGTSAGDRNK